VCQAIEQGGRHFGVEEDRRPFAEAEICHDHDACALMEFAQEMEEHRAAGGAERQVAEFVEDHEIKAGEAFGDLTGLALCLFLFEGIDELDGREEADLSPVMLDGLDAKGRRDMILYREPSSFFTLRLWAPGWLAAMRATRSERGTARR